MPASGPSLGTGKPEKYLPHSHLSIPVLPSSVKWVRKMGMWGKGLGPYHLRCRRCRPPGSGGVAGAA